LNQYHGTLANFINMLRKLLELIRFSHTIFALPFALLSAILAWQLEAFRPLDLVGILLCLVFARSAAMAFNRLVDRRWDALNPRTANRHLPAGTLTVRTVWLFTLVTTLGFLLSTTLFLLRDPANYWPLYLSLPVLAIVLCYSLTKRFTSLAHFWLGFALMLAPVAAWIAIRGIVSFQDLSTPLLLGAAVLFWVSGFDILYACQDADFDRQAGLHSIPARLGIRNSLRLAAVCHAIMFGLLVGLGFLVPSFGVIYFSGLALIAALLIYEHWIVRPDDLTRVNQAFFQVNGIISMGLLLLVIVQLLVK
jgi:4-hydroxybenzoate polyprenyltransferase